MRVGIDDEDRTEKSFAVQPINGNGNIGIRAKAAAGIRPGMVYGETDDFSYNIVKDPVGIHDFQATLLYLLGIDHLKLTYKFQGRDFRLTDVAGNVVTKLLA